MTTYHKAEKFRIHLDNKQDELFTQYTGCDRFVYNKLLAYCNEKQQEEQRIPNKSELQEHLIALKSEFTFLKEPHSQSMQYPCDTLDKAFKKAFSPYTKNQRDKAIAKSHNLGDDELYKSSKIAKAHNCGFPKFKRKHDNNDTLHYTQNVKVGKGYITLPKSSKIGKIKYRNHRDIQGTVKNATISKEGNKWYISIQYEFEKEEPKPIENPIKVAFDLGLTDFLAFSDGTVIKPLKAYRKLEEQIKNVQRQLSHKRTCNENKGSLKRRETSNREKQLRLRLQTLHIKAKNQRKDFIHKITHYMRP